MWCYCKRHVRKWNDGKNNKFKDLKDESRDEFNKSEVNLKLWNRFWKTLNLYKDGGTYKDVLTTYFGAKSSSRVVSHNKNNKF